MFFAGRAIPRRFSPHEAVQQKRPRYAGPFRWPTRKDSELRRPACDGVGWNRHRGTLMFLPAGRFREGSHPTRQSNKKRPRYAGPFRWPTRKDSNLRPSESESDALSSCATGSEYDDHFRGLSSRYYSTNPLKMQPLFEKKSSTSAPRFRFFGEKSARTCLILAKNTRGRCKMRSNVTIFGYSDLKTQKTLDKQRKLRYNYTVCLCPFRFCTTCETAQPRAGAQNRPTP